MKEAGNAMPTARTARNCRRRTCALLALLLLLPAAAVADEKLWSMLQSGGQVVLMRHGQTSPGNGDPPGMRVDDCATQRNLVDDGRQQAREVGAAFKSRRVPVQRVLSSPWCRCIETAELAFSRPEVSEALGNLFGRPENQAGQVRALRQLVDEHRGPGNLVLVSHGSTIAALTGISPGMAELVVVTPQDDGRFSVAGLLVAHSR